MLIFLKKDTQKKNSFGRFISKFKTVNEGNSERRDRSIEIIQTETQRGKRRGNTDKEFI